MAQPKGKTQPTKVDVDTFIDALADASQRADAQVIAAMMARLSGEPATMWGTSIIGFGACRYRYESGREGEMCRVGFSPRKGQTVVYLVDGHADQTENLARLGKHKIGKSCLYFNRLSDIDQDVLEAMITASLAHMTRKYPGG